MRAIEILMEPKPERKVKVLYGRLWEVGCLVRCINGRHKGAIGTISYYNPKGHNDNFFMRVDPDVGERVNPGNWEMIEYED